MSNATVPLASSHRVPSGFPIPPAGEPALQDSVTECLRSWTENPLGSARRVSNPFAVVHCKATSSSCQATLRPSTARLHMGQPRLPWKSNGVASCFPREISNTTSKTLPDHTYLGDPKKANFAKCLFKFTTGAAWVYEFAIAAPLA